MRGGGGTAAAGPAVTVTKDSSDDGDDQEEEEEEEEDSSDGVSTGGVEVPAGNGVSAPRSKKLARAVPAPAPRVTNTVIESRLLASGKMTLAGHNNE